MKTPLFSALSRGPPFGTRGERSTSRPCSEIGADQPCLLSSGLNGGGLAPTVDVVSQIQSCSEFRRSYLDRTRRFVPAEDRVRVHVPNVPKSSPSQL